MSNTTQLEVAVMTPYAAAKIANAALVEAGIEKVLPPQMFYNYTSARIRAGKAPFIACDADGKVTAEGLAAWLAKYIAKHTAVEAVEA